MQRLEVMVVINGLGTGGAERSIAELAPLLRDRGIELSFVCSYTREVGVESDLLSQGFQVNHLRRKSFLGRVGELRAVIRSREPDLVHTTLIESDILGRLAATGSGIPVVSSLVNTSYDPVRLEDPNINRLSFEVVRLIDGFTARHMAAGFHALTEAVAEDAVKALGISRDQITVIGRGRDMSRLGSVTPERRRKARAALGLNETHQVVLAVGRQEFQKGHSLLVELAAEMRSNDRLKIVIAGRPGSQSSDIERSIRDQGLDKAILLLGHRSDLPDLLVAADVFAFPSRYEGFGGSLLEAMALGVAVVASDLPVLHEVGGNSIRYADSGDVSAWVKAVGALLSDESLGDDLSRKARSRVEDAFDLGFIADEYAMWYGLVSSSTGLDLRQP